MKFETYLLLAALLFGIWKTHRAVKRSASPAERFFAIRASVFTWMVGITLLLAMLFLPNRQRVLFLLPGVVAVLLLVKMWRGARERLRREREDQLNFERMKRVN